MDNIIGGQSRKNKKWPKPKKHEVANAENTEGPHNESPHGGGRRRRPPPCGEGRPKAAPHYVVP